MTKIFDEEVVFKQKVVAPQLTIQEGGAGDLSVVDDLLVSDDATIGGDLAVTGDSNFSGDITGVYGVTHALGASSAITLTGGDITLTAATTAVSVYLYGGAGVAIQGAVVDIGTDSSFSNVITIGGADAGDILIQAASTVTIEADVISIGEDTSQVQFINIGHSSADSIDLVAATGITIESADIDIGTDSAFSADVTIGDGYYTQLHVDVFYFEVAQADTTSPLSLWSAGDVDIDASAIIGVGDTSATSITVGNTGATVSVLGGPSITIGGAYVDIGTATTMSNYVTIGAAGGGGSCRIGRQASLASATVTGITVSAADLGKLVVFAGDSTCTLTLPAAEAGIFVDVFVTASTSAMTVSAAAGDYFVEADGDTASSFALSAFNLYHIVAVDGVRWVATFGSVPDLTP